MRRTQKSVYASVVKSYRDKVLPLAPFAVEPYGGEKPEWFDYPNGSRVWIGGMDNTAKILGQEMDFIYVNQAEQLTLADWETLTSRTTGRAGNAPISYTFGDCNPDSPAHWIVARAREKKFSLLESRHVDNPRLYDHAGKILPAGVVTMGVLDALTGVRKERLRYGRWVQADGAVYEFDARVHRVPRFEIPKEWRRVRGIDFGFENPFVCGWWAIDPDGRMYLYREIYQTKRIVADHARRIKELSKDERFEATISDHDAEDRETLRLAGIQTIPAFKEIRRGIEIVAQRLRVNDDGKPRLFVLEGATVERDQALADKRLPT
ncbi:MAG: hypothetical protein L0Y55_12900, partial [Anaerolineales bacterium]|nr:hypothetical protein [Anaerolineales bacterium]